MKHRNWFLVVAAGALIHAFGLMRAGFMLSFYVSYGDTDVVCATLLAITCIAAWATLEVVSQFLARRIPRCRCGYSIAGLKCPECGQTLG